MAPVVFSNFSLVVLVEVLLVVVVGILVEVLEVAIVVVVATVVLVVVVNLVVLEVTLIGASLVSMILVEVKETLMNLAVILFNASLSSLDKLSFSSEEFGTIGEGLAVMGTLERFLPSFLIFFTGLDVPVLKGVAEVIGGGLLVEVWSIVLLIIGLAVPNI